MEVKVPPLPKGRKQPRKNSVPQADVEDIEPVEDSTPPQAEPRDQRNVSQSLFNILAATGLAVLGVNAYTDKPTIVKDTVVMSSPTYDKKIQHLENTNAELLRDLNNLRENTDSLPDAREFVSRSEALKLKATIVKLIKRITDLESASETQRVKLGRMARTVRRNRRILTPVEADSIPKNWVKYRVVGPAGGWQ